MFDAYGEEGLKGGAPPPGAADAGPAAAAAAGGAPGFTSFTFMPGQGFKTSYSGVDAARAANIFADIFGDGFPGFGAAPRSRVRMFSRKGSAGRDMGFDGFGGVFEQLRQQQQQQKGQAAGRQQQQQQQQPAGSGTGGFAFGGGGAGTHFLV